MSNNTNVPSRIIVAAGTYDGVLVGWDTVKYDGENDINDSQKEKKKRSNHNNGNDDDKRPFKLHMSYALAAHEGSVRCLSISGSSATNDKSNSPIIEQPGLLLSGGFDEALRVFDLKKHVEAGETKTPQDLGTPTCASFAPPGINPTHCLVGLTSGKILLYKKKDWTVVHVLGGGHSSDGTTTGEGVSCVAVHPTGRMAMSAGVKDGKICLWDLMKGRLAFVHKVSSKKSGSVMDRISSLAWSHDGSRYVFSHGTKLTARDVTSGEDLLDIQLPSRINQVCFLKGGEDKGFYYVACACNDGSLPVLAVGAISIDRDDDDDDDENMNEKSKQGIIRAVMAIEPVDRNLAGEDRIKCIQSLKDGYLVATANSGGTISIMDLSGAIKMIEEEDPDNEPGESDEDSDDELLAVDILDSVRVGSGARITNIACWSSGDANVHLQQNQDEDPIDKDTAKEENSDEIVGQSKREILDKEDKKRKRFQIKGNGKETIEMDDAAIVKARNLVKQAKKRQKRKEKKKKK